MLYKSPCLNCPDRVLGCHSHCDRYLSYRGKVDSQKANILEQNKAVPHEYRREKHTKYIRKHAGGY